jgi:hypothetical protein
MKKLAALVWWVTFIGVTYAMCFGLLYLATL